MALVAVTGILGVYICSIAPAARAGAAVASRQAGDLSGEPAQAASGLTGGRVPVILVHGLRGSGESTWGQPEYPGDQPKGMYLSLCRSGYEPGKTLFVCDYEEDNLGDFREIARRFLVPAIDRALQASGLARVDLVCRSMGGLVGRAYVSSPDYRGDIRTLVMIATPSRGSFGAGIVKAAEMTELQEQLRHRGAVHELPLERPELPRKDRLDVKFTNEVEYVSRQALKVWEPVFNHYYATAWLLAEAAGGGRRQPPDFFRWLAEEFPEPYVELIKDGQRPPLSPAYEPAGPGSFVLAAPGPGESLTVAYYNLLAVQTARRNFFAGLRSEPSEATTPGVPGQSLLERVVGWFQRVIGERLGAWARKSGQGLLLWAMDHLAGLDPRGRAADCLIEEYAGLSVGGPLAVDTGGQQAVTRYGGAVGQPSVVGNYYLKTWNDYDAGRREAEGAQAISVAADGFPAGVRYVSLAGQIPNVWSAWWPDVGPNDVIVETSSTFLPLEDNDVYGLYASLVTTNHSWLGGGGKCYKDLVSALTDYYPVQASFGPKYTPGRSKLVEYTRQGRATATTYRPTYLELKLPASGQARVELTVEQIGPARTAAGGLAAGEPGLQAWAYLDLGRQGLWRYPLAFTADGTGLWTASLELNVPVEIGQEARVLVGLRTEADGDPAVGPPADVKTAFRYTLGFTPGEVNAVGQAGSASGGAAQGASGQDTSPPQGSGEPVGLPQAPASVPAVPRIYATHRDKETVSLMPQVTAHARWEWDFGDGTVLADDDPGHIESAVSHAFPGPGTYTVRAVSTAGDGQPLAEWAWEEAIGEDGEHSRTYTATTLPVVDVELRLEGPLAWVTGRPAEYRLSYTISPLPPGVIAELTYLYPGPAFEMVWQKPGTFTVTGALAVRITYDGGSGLWSVTNVYTVDRAAKVYATVITD